MVGGSRSEPPTIAAMSPSFGKNLEADSFFVSLQVWEGFLRDASLHAPMNESVARLC
jgi:hypothetical protein